MRKEFLGIDLSNDRKANYLSRLFGIFYEDLIGFCLKTKGFNMKGRPSVYDLTDRYLRKTFDFALEKGGKNYIAEAKCYIAYQNFKHIELTAALLDDKYFDPDDKSAFQFFLELGSKRKPYRKYRFYCDEYGNTPFSPDGKILIWARVKRDDVERIKEEYHFSYVFSVETIIRDTISENRFKSVEGREYCQCVQERKNWADELFSVLSGNNIPYSTPP